MELDKERLIAEIQSRRPIWDQSDPKHKDRREVHAQWDELQRIFRIDKKELREKIWKNLVDTFRRHFNEMKKKYNGNESSMIKEIDFVKWPYFKQLWFMQYSVGSRVTKPMPISNGGGIEFHVLTSDQGEPSLKPEFAVEDIAADQEQELDLDLTVDHEDAAAAARCTPSPAARSTSSSPLTSRPKTSSEPLVKRPRQNNLPDEVAPSMTVRQNGVRQQVPENSIINSTFGNYVATLLDQVDGQLQIQCHRVITDILFTAVQSRRIPRVYYAVEHKKAPIQKQLVSKK